MCKEEADFNIFTLNNVMYNFYFAPFLFAVIKLELEMAFITH